MIAKKKENFKYIKHKAIEYIRPKRYQIYRSLNDAVYKIGTPAIYSFIAGNYYVSEYDGCLTDEKGNKNHNVNNDLFKNNFVEIISSYSFEELKKLNKSYDT